MITKKAHRILTYCITTVWFINGLFYKVLNLVPRHQEIVAEITNSDNARMLTILIGIAEILMSFWVLSQFKSRINAIIQIVVIATMNILEFFLASNLLLWGKFNALFALLFILVVYSNEFVLKRKIQPIAS